MKDRKKIKIFQKQSKGFSLFLSVLLMSIIATISFSVFEIFYLQILMTGNIRDSQTAFYTADYGLECIYYNDIKMNRIKNSIESRCNSVGKILALPEDIWQLFFTDGTCVTIKTKFNDPAPFTTRIQTYGRNKYTGFDCDAPVSRRVERGLEVEY